MDTCEYCDTEITIAAEVVLGPDGPERQGCCERCGHLVAVCADAPRAGSLPVAS